MVNSRPRLRTVPALTRGGLEPGAVPPVVAEASGWISKSLVCFSYASTEILSLLSNSRISSPRLVLSCSSHFSKGLPNFPADFPKITLEAPEAYPEFPSSRVKNLNESIRSFPMIP